MSTTTSTDLTNVVLLFADFTGVDNILALSNNTTYEFIPPSHDADPNSAWLGELSKMPQGPILCLKFDKDMFSSNGWVLGSAPDTDAADIQLAEDNTKGVSKRHFRIDIHPLSYKPRVTVLSRSLRFIAGNDDYLLTQHEEREITESAVFDLGGTEFLAWRPKLTSRDLRIYRKKALKFSNDAVLAMPKYFPALSSAPETITSNVRYGKNEKVYVFQSHSGKGASASVMLVQERTSGDIFAAKEPYYKSSDDPGIRRNRWEELNKESEYLSRLDHPHIVEVYGIVLAHDDKLPPWLIEEYIPDCLLPKDLDEQGTIIVATQLFSAVAYMHSLDIVHRDLKPDNILMKNGEVKVGDFGTARYHVQGNMDTFTGTPIYSAPEFLDAPRGYTSKVDMFSLGILLLECLTRWEPRSDSGWPDKALSRSTHAQWMRDVIIPHILDAPVYLRPLLRGLLRRTPKKRWSALKSLVWLGNEIEAGDKHTVETYSHAHSREKADTDEETVRFDSVTAPTPQESFNRRKRPASVTLSEGGGDLRVRPTVDFGHTRLSMFGEDLPQLPVLPCPSSQSPVARDPSIGMPYTTPTLLLPEVDHEADHDHVPVSRSPAINQQCRISFAGAPPASPSWAPTPDRDEGEFPISGEDNEYSLEESDTELLQEWNGTESNDEDYLTRI